MNISPLHILELHMKLQQNRKASTEYKARIAQQQQQKINDINIMLEGGRLSTKQVSDVLGIPLSVVESQKARLDRHDKLRRRFLTTGIVQPYKEQPYPCVTIYQK